MLLVQMDQKPPLNILDTVDCGSHHATTCTNCPFYFDNIEDPNLCNGDCAWDHNNGDCRLYDYYG